MQVTHYPMYCQTRSERHQLSSIFIHVPEGQLLVFIQVHNALPNQQGPRPGQPRLQDYFSRLTFHLP